MASTASILVDLQKLELIANQYGIGSREELARRLGLNRGSIYRAAKTGRVGGEFVARTLTYLPVQFSDVFEPQVEEADYGAIDLAKKAA